MNGIVVTPPPPVPSPSVRDDRAQNPLREHAPPPPVEPTRIDYYGNPEMGRPRDPVVAEPPRSAYQPPPPLPPPNQYGYPPAGAVLPPPAPTYNPPPMNSTNNNGFGSGAGFTTSRDAVAATNGLRRLPDGTYKVQPNDSYWNISERAFGTGSYFKALAEHNRGKIPRDDRLQAGTTISVPSIAELEKAYPDLCPKPNHRRPALANMAPAGTPGLSMVSQTSGRRTYVVAEGDTLFDIAKFELGKQSRWGELYELNREILGDHYDYLVPGTVLTLPAGEPANTNRNHNNNLTNRPDSIYRR